MKASRQFPDLSSGQRELLPLTLTGFRPDPQQGQHREFVAEVNGTPYHCKRDRNGKPLRATEWFCTSLAGHLNFAVPDFAAIRNPENDEILFGSKETWGTSNGFAVQTFLTAKPSFDPAVGDPYAWLGSYLSRLYVFDVFVGNPDRQISNFLLANGSGNRTLLAFDFASSELQLLGTTNFLVADTPTMFVGRQLRKLRPFDMQSALELTDWIERCSPQAIEAIFTSMPTEWMPDNERGKIVDLWSTGMVKVRLDALRRGLGNGSLL